MRCGQKLSCGFESEVWGLNLVQKEIGSQCRNLRKEKYRQEVGEDDDLSREKCTLWIIKVFITLSRVIYIFFHLSASQPHNDFITTQAGNLKCKKIIHLVAQNDIKSLVSKVLQECELRKYTSVAFPAIGTGLCFLWKIKLKPISPLEAKLILCDSIDISAPGI